MNAHTHLLSRTGGLLLAGGRSERFGAEKAVALFRGRVLMDIVSECFVGCAAFAVSAVPGSAAELHARETGAQILHDDPSCPPGPLVGVHAGLRWAGLRGLEYLAITPCDVPLLPKNVFERLIAEMGEASAVYATTRSGEHPLCAIWRVSLAGPLSQVLQSGGHPAVRAFLAPHNVVRVSFDEDRLFANVNTLEELRRLERAA